MPGEPRVGDTIVAHGRAGHVQGLTAGKSYIVTAVLGTNASGQRLIKAVGDHGRETKYSFQSWFEPLGYRPDPPAAPVQRKTPAFVGNEDAW